MRRTTVLLCAALAGCGVLPPDDTARMPTAPDGGPEMTQNDAIAISSWVLMNPGVAQGRPELAARAVAAEDWLAGQFRLTPDFAEYHPVTEVSWGALRREVRAAIGVAPQAKSQDVIGKLFTAARALHAGDRAAALALLQPPNFSLGPEGTLHALANLPKFRNAEWAYDELNRNENRDSNCRAPTC